MFLAMVYTRDGAHRVGLEDAILRTSKDVTTVDDVGSNTGHAEEEFGSREEKSELGVAEDSTPGKVSPIKGNPNFDHVIAPPLAL